MLDFKNVSVSNLAESIVASGYAMQISDEKTKWEINNLSFWLNKPFILDKFEYLINNTEFVNEDTNSIFIRCHNKNKEIDKEYVTLKIKLSEDNELVCIYLDDKAEIEDSHYKSIYLPMVMDYFTQEYTNTEICQINDQILSNLHEYITNQYSLFRAIKHVRRAFKLANTAFCSGHRSFMKGINVSFDMKYTQYITKHFQRYEHFVYVSSSSLMHKITSMDFNLCCAKYVSQEIVDSMNERIKRYNDARKNRLEHYTFTLRDGEVIKANTYNDVMYLLFMDIIQNCPMGVELFVRVNTNYEQLAIIYNQRKFHKLKEDYDEFFKMIDTLPLKNIIKSVENIQK